MTVQPPPPPAGCDAARAYGDAFADVYDEWYADVSDVAATVDALVALAEGGPVLELGVGTGRLALPLACRGVPVTGIDASPAMLERLAAKPGAELVRTLVGDMARDLPEGPYRLVFVAYNTLFNLTGPDEQQACFDSVAGRLTPGGRFVVEAFVPDPDRPGGSTVTVRSVTADGVVLSADLHDPGQQRVDGAMIELRDGAAPRVRPWHVRYATPAELDAMAVSAGFHLEARWASFGRQPFTDDSPQHVSVFRLGAPVGPIADVE